MTTFAPINAHEKACPTCGQRAPLDAPEPVRHRCLHDPPRGLGDRLADVLAPVARMLGWETCRGCKSRQETLNRWWPNRALADRERAMARLAVCARCDQAIAGRCTMSGLDLGQLAPEPEATCPARRWPGDAEFVEPPLPAGTLPLPPPDRPAAWLIYFPHGLGDHAQLTALLAHVRAARPLLSIDVVARADGSHLLTHLARRVFIAGRDHPDAAAYDLTTGLTSGGNRWAEPKQTYPDAPATKTSRALRQCLGLPRLPALDGYHLPEPPGDILDAAARWTKSIAQPIVLVHPRGRCGPMLKNIPPDALTACLAAIRAADALPVLIDYDGVCADVLADQGATGNLLPVLNAATCPEAASPLFLIALARLARLTIGIDSGPGHIFQSVRQTPAIIYWRRHHPVNYSDAPDHPHILHLVPSHAGVWIKGDRATGEAYFAAHYRHQVYTDAARDLAAAITEALK
jgi:hypothetical protein